ncbi:MAG: hypothetical protein VX519_08225 [Myxococcota bacterium]|nr:hypothetical protein [Myxococcota bacterium]
MIAWLLLGCATGDSSLFFQESWEVLAINNDQSLIDIRFSRGNTGLLKGQGQSRFDLVLGKEVPILYGRNALPRDTQPAPEAGLLIGPDKIQQVPEGWNVQFQSSELSARLTIQDQPGNEPLEPPLSDSWQVAAHSTLAHIEGFVHAGTRSNLINGQSIVLHRYGDDPPGLRGTTRVAAFVLSEDASLGVDQRGTDALAWAHAEGRSWNAETAVVKRLSEGVVEMDYRPSAPIVARLEPGKSRLRRQPWEHLYGLERWLLGVVRGVPDRRIRSATAQVQVGEASFRAPALILVVDYR